MDARRLSLLGLAAVSGLLLFLADHPVHAWYLQAVALIPLLVALAREARSSVDALLAGLATGLVNLVPLAVVLEFPLLMAAGLGLYLTLIWVLLALGCFWTLRRGPAPVGALAAGAVAVLLEWLDFHAVPVWGTAQSFVRVWSAAPRAIQMVELGGMLLLVFVLVAGQALAARIIVSPRGRGTHALTLGLLLAAVALHAGLVWPRRADGTLRVGAVGWTSRDLPAGPPSVVLETLYRPLALKALGRGARLVVSPEVGFRLGAEERQAILAKLARIARDHGAMLAVGYFDLARDDNRIAFIDGAGRLAGEYVKMHLIPTVERYRAGSGALVKLEGPRFAPAPGRPPGRAVVGGMICQDDNFTDLARGYGRLGAQVVAVPTNDWRQVKDYHLENSIFRAVESRYGVVRAASSGVSAIIAPSGELLARSDHFHDGPRAIVADLPLRSSTATLYARWGDWPALACLLGLALAFPLLRRRVGADGK